jgi:hypothetical protein
VGFHQEPSGHWGAATMKESRTSGATAASAGERFSPRISLVGPCLATRDESEPRSPAPCRKTSSGQRFVAGALEGNESRKFSRTGWATSVVRVWEVIGLAESTPAVRNSSVSNRMGMSGWGGGPANMGIVRPRGVFDGGTESAFAVGTAVPRRPRAGERHPCREDTARDP